MEHDRISRDELGMFVASGVAKRSTCHRLHVGALLTLDGRPLGWGYNGAAEGEPHCGEECKNATNGCPNSVHAEANAIAYCARKGIATEGSTLYVTTAPCYACAGLLLGAGVKKVIYEKYYRDPSGLNRLAKRGIELVHWSPAS